MNALDDNLQIIACAGSGKTQVISLRIAKLLTSGKAKPEEIIAFTYTEKAAAELKARVLSLARQELGNQLGLADMYIGTIHGWCFGILQDACLEFQKFDVLDDVKQALFVNKTYKTNGMLDLDMERYKDTAHFIGLMGLVRESELTADLPEPIAAALGKYERTLRDDAWFDFTMIRSETAKRLENDEAFRSRIASRAKYLIVDEYQYG